MAVPAPTMTEHEYLSNLNTQSGAGSALDTYYQAFPDEKEFLEGLRGQHGDDNTLDILLESLQPSEKIEAPKPPAAPSFREGSMAQLREIDKQIEPAPVERLIEEEEQEREKGKQAGGRRAPTQGG